jgi:hypothetical protein
MRTFKFLIVGAFILTMNSVQAQRDMILTQAGEELRCRIIDETPIRFVFVYLKNGKPYRSEIFKTLVTSFKFDYYAADLPNADKLPKAMYRAMGSSDSESPRALSPGNTSLKKQRIRNKQSKEAAAEESLDDITEAETSRTTIDNKVGTEKTDVETAIVNNDKKGSKSEKKANAQSVNAGATITDSQEGNLEIKKAPSDKGNTRVASNVIDTSTGISEAEFPNITINQKNKFRVGIKGGIGNRLDNSLQTISSYDLYLERLLRGWILGADVAYFPNDVFGFGAIFTDFKSRNSDSEIEYRNEFTGAEQVGSIANSRSVKFVGPALFLRKKLDYRTYVVLGLSPGYNFYTDKGSYNHVDYTFKGGGFGAASTLGIDFLLGNDVIGRDIILSFEAVYNYGKIDALDYGDARSVIDLPTSLDLSRLDFTIGLRFIRLPKYLRLTSY